MNLAMYSEYSSSDNTGMTFPAVYAMVPAYDTMGRNDGLKMNELSRWE